MYSNLASQFDACVWFDQSRAVRYENLLKKGLIFFLVSLFLSFFLFLSHARTHVHARARTHTHTHTHMHTHTHIQTYTHTHAHTHIYIYIYIYIHTHKRIHTRTHFFLCFSISFIIPGRYLSGYFK